MTRHLTVWPILAALTAVFTLVTGSTYNCEPLEPTPTACRTNADCELADPSMPAVAQEFCLKDPGDCEGLGTCTERPVMGGCPRLWAPVCGCDGETYANDCLSSVAGVSVDYEGECEPERCWSNGDCDRSHYCAMDGCAAETGTCVTRPFACPLIWAPVCGCDGQTYGNGCEAAAAGVNVDHEGECEPERCWGNGDCDRSHYCAMDGCAAETGACAPRPDMCPEVWMPVCGCDGETYVNRCQAAEAGVNVDYEGECDSEPRYCWENSMCPRSEYCFFAHCGLESGVCAARPEACPFLWAPVCGCDGATYANDCVAASEGMSVDYQGECRLQ